MKRIIFITLSIVISLITPVKAKIIEPINILDNFNICVTSSSLGQRCKDINFNYRNFFNSGKKLSTTIQLITKLMNGIITLKLLKPQTLKQL